MPANLTDTAADTYLQGLLDCLTQRQPLPAAVTAKDVLAAMTAGQPDKSADDPEKKRAEEFLEILGVLLCNLDYAKPAKSADSARAEPDDDKVHIDKQMTTRIRARINELLTAQMNVVFHQPAFRELEGTWRSIEHLVAKTDFSLNVGISLLDATKEEIGEDLAMNMADLTGSEFFKKVYVAEYDQLGGEPYGAIIGLYDFENSSGDRKFLRTMAGLCKESHAPFVASASPNLFKLEGMQSLLQIRDFSAAIGDYWGDLRESEEFAYIGLTLPRYIVRSPYTEKSSEGGILAFSERPPKRDTPDDKDYEPYRYVWGRSAMLFACNLVRSFQNAGWCQYIRGTKGGGLIEGLARIPLEDASDGDLLPPLEVVIPDYAEFGLAQAGLIPLVHKKGTTDAVFFSCQSMKRASIGTDTHISENSQLTTNLAYTYSISRIAHYLKRMLRNNIGTSADATYVHAQIDTWISRYVTTIVNPDDLTLRYYPFKAYALNVVPVPGRVGFYNASLTIQPHIQFEGMDVVLRVDARLS